MKTLRRFYQRLTSWATRQRDEDRLRAEIEEHLALQTEENVRAGLSPLEARRQAALKFGAVESVKEEYREQRTLPFAELLVRDTRYALRRLRKAPAFTLATVVTLGLGIGATTSIFTLVHAVIFKSLAVASPEQLYRLGKESRCCYWGGFSQEKEFSLVSYELYQHFRDNTRGFSELAAFSAGQPAFGVRRKSVSEQSQSYPGEYVSGNYFVMFGIQAYAGRVLSSSDDHPGAPPVAMMSYRLWQQRYGADPSVVGSIFHLNDKPFTVVGITPPGFFSDTLRNHPPDFYLPLNTEPYVQTDSDLYAAGTHWLELIGRIRPGVTHVAVEAGMRVELTQWLRSHWGEMDANARAKFPVQTLYLVPGGAGITSMRDAYQSWLRILMTVTAFVLLIACANVASLMLVRGIEQRRQISLSLALGARSTRLMMQTLSESIILALLGGAMGLAIAFAGTRLVLHFAFPAVDGLAGVPISASPSMPVLLFALTVSLITGIAFGMGPAWMATRVDPIEALRGTGRATTRTGSFSRKTLVVFQAAVSLVLLSAAGLLTAALHNLEHQNLGFEQDHRIVVSWDPRLAGYRLEQLTPLYQRIQASLSALPDVSGAALCTYSPMGGNSYGAGIRVDGRPAPGPNDDNQAFWNRVTAGFFPTVGNPIVRGRAISEHDIETSRHVAVINEAFARRFFPNEDPIGKYFGQHGLGSEREYEIVGIARDARYLTFKLDKPVGPFFFLPEGQHDFLRAAPSKDANPGSHFLRDIVVETRPGATLGFGQVSQAIASVDPNLPVVSIRTLRDQVSRQFSQQRLIARLTSFFGVLSLLLAAVGVYGVAAYNAERRVNEIGVRMALGANRRHVVLLVLRGAFSLIALGLLLGLPLTFASGRFLGSQLYGMSPYNPLVTALAVLSLSAAAVVATVMPAIRASLISPSEALRSE